MKTKEISHQEQEALAVWERPSNLLAMVFDKKDFRTQSKLPFKPSKGLDMKIVNRNDPMGPLIRICKEGGPLVNSVVLSHIDIDELLSIVSVVKYGIPATFKETDDSLAWSREDGTVPSLPYHVAWALHYRYKVVEEMIAGVISVQEKLFNEYLNVDTRLSFEGGNYIYFDGKEVIHFLYPK